ncbi:hypothetical protein OsI_20295 [Oryza sativa Indica Group]|uniref:Uncharacterized protein n=1 Tax=Oryza sativa subsp. indica TaxID=39946 RepID=B8AZ30_ORYSI|nr:hypothetical protein OsI_20295 [Oryza sativa Indica Group]
MADIKNRADFMDVELLTMKRRSICFLSPPLKSSTSDFTLNTPKGVYINLPKVCFFLFLSHIFFIQ